MKNTNKLISIILLGVINCLLGNAVAFADKPLGMEEAVRIALDENPQLKAVCYELKVRDAQKMRARSLFLPKLDIEQVFLRSNNPVTVFMEKLNQELFSQEDFSISHLNDPSPRTDWGTKFILTQPLFNGGREYIGHALAKKAYEIAGLKKEAILNLVIYRVKRAYMEALLKMKMRKVVEKALDTSRKNLELARRRYLAGTALKSDVLAAEARLMRLDQELATARAEEQTATNRLNSIMARPQGAKWVLDEDALLCDLEPRSMDYWVMEARRHRPELKIAQRLVDMAEIEKRGAKLHFLPSINLKGNYELHSEDPFSANGESWSLMAVASFNLFNGMKDKAGLIEAGANLERAKAQKTRAEIDTEFQVRSAYNAYLAARKAIGAAKKEVIHAREALRLLRKRYAQGLALMVEVLGAEDAVKLAELGLELARFEAKLAELRLRLYVGTAQTN